MKKWFWPVTLLLTAAVFLADLLYGAAGFSFQEVMTALFTHDGPESVRKIVVDIRLTKAVTALLAGAAVSVSGLLMQTLFRNPLAGPYVLGVSSGASFGAALFVLGSSALGIGGHLGANFGLAAAAWTGAALVLMLVSLASHRIKDIMIILILGMMLGSGIDAFVQILQYLSDEAALKSYVVWTMGSLSSVTPRQLLFLGLSVTAGLLLALGSVKSLNLLLLGEEYARTMGLSVQTSRRVIFLATILLAGTVTAFCGPLGFVGLAVPHLTRFLLKDSNHRTLLPATLLTGALVLLTCDLVAKMTALPINSITSLLGIPIVIWVVLKNKSL